MTFSLVACACGARKSYKARSCRECACVRRAARALVQGERSTDALMRHRERARAQGLCGSCRSRPAEPRRVSCHACLVQSRAYTERATAAGMCSQCHVRPASPYLRCCRTCLDRQARRYRASKATP